ncbi:MAG: hypothetical protein LBU39_00125 [Desulfobulbaceae bacterium]|jgi:phosphatidylserine decarboxylase|nr:hypothetical protein [Desulfobulbaceae bacterium]
MKKSMLALLLAASFTFVAVGASFAAKVDCTVDGVDGDKVTMTCEKSKGLEAGAKVKVDTKKKAAVEGC